MAGLSPRVAGAAAATAAGVRPAHGEREVEQDERPHAGPERDQTRPLSGFKHGGYYCRVPTIATQRQVFARQHAALSTAASCSPRRLPVSRRLLLRRRCSEGDAQS